MVTTYRGELIDGQYAARSLQHTLSCMCRDTINMGSHLQVLHNKSLYFIENQHRKVDVGRSRVQD